MKFLFDRLKYRRGMQLQRILLVVVTTLPFFGFAQAQKEKPAVTFEELYDEPFSINKLFVGFQPLYGELFATNVNAGFGIEAMYYYKDKFDIKTRGLMPLIDGARLFTMSLHIKGINNTYLRFKQLAMVDSKNAEIFLNCAEAFQALSKIRVTEGMKNDDSGQYINIEQLSKNDREILKNSLLPMRDLEELIKDSFQLTQFS